MDEHESLQAFLAGRLGSADARRFDEHLLECEACWQAVREDRAGRLAAQVVRLLAPPGLTDRIAFAVEVAASARSQRPPAKVLSGLGWQLADGGIAVIGVLVAMLVLLPGVRGTPAMPAAVQAVARYAQTIAPPAGPLPWQAGARRTSPTEVDPPVSVTAGGQLIVLRTWRLGGTEAVVAVSQGPFPMPAGATDASGGGMAWSSPVGKLRLYCLNGQTSELIATPVPAAELAVLAGQLQLN